MKTILTILAVSSVLGFASPSEIQARDFCSHGHTRVVSYLPCGRPIYAVYQVYGYDRCGNPVGHWVTQRESCGCSRCSPPRHYAPSCPPERGFSGSSAGLSGHSYHGSGRSWFFSFGR